MTSLQAASAAAPPWVRRPWCVWLAVGIVLLGAVLNLNYVFNHCPLDLSEDESHYWEWSRHLDYGYYSKPPGIAWVIRGGVELGRLLGADVSTGGGAMPWVRLPAVIFGLITGLALLDLARRVFRDDRAGLAVVVLSGAVPMFVVGGLLITIDSPMYMCWTLTLWALWRYVEPRNVSWLYLAALFCALGMLFKPVLIALPMCAALAAWLDPHIRTRLKTLHSLGALAIILASQIPVLLWNAQHHWVTFRHIGTQGGLAAAAGPQPDLLHRFLGHLLSFVSYLAGQTAVLGGIIGVLLVLAILRAFRWRRTEGLRWNFLLAFALPLWLFYALLSLWTNTEPNWPAATYAAGMVLLAGVVAYYWNHREESASKAWRQWTSIAVVSGVVIAALALNLHRIYPLLANECTSNKSPRHPRKWDPSARLRGLAQRGAVVGQLRAEFEKESPGVPVYVVTGRYDTSSSLSFYLPGQPFVPCIMSRVGGRMNQYDLWPDAPPPGANVLLIGGFSDAQIQRVIRPAFARIDQDAQGKPNFQRVPVLYHGAVLKEVWALKCYGFKEWPERQASGTY